MAFSILSIWIVLLPFIVWSGRFEAPKVLVFLVGGAGLVIFWIFRILFKKKSLEFSRGDIFYLLWLVILLVSGFMETRSFDALVGDSYRHQGVIFFFILWLVYKTVEILEKSQKKKLSKLLAFGVLTEALVAIIQIVTGNTYFGKPLGTIGETNALAGFLGIGSYFIYGSLPKIFIFFPLAATIVTESRAGLLSFLVNSGILVTGLSLKLRKILPIILIVLSAVLIAYFSAKQPQSFFENRLEVWRLGVGQFLQRPILGYGAESNASLYNQAFYKSGFPLSGLVVERSHNLFIDVAVWSGTVGFFLFGGWLYLSYKNLSDASKKFAFFSFLVYSMFQPLGIVHWILFFLIL